MEKVKDVFITPGVRYTKVKFCGKIFKRFQYIWMGKTMDIQWADSESQFMNDSFEKQIEDEFKKKVG